MRAGWTESGACISGSTALPKGATRRASGGAVMTSTTSAERLSGLGPSGSNPPLHCRRQDVSETYAGGCNAASLGAADWLCLAAAPIFAIMALLMGVLGGGRPDALCSAVQDGSPLGGMVPMYVLMSAFH